MQFNEFLEEKTKELAKPVEDFIGTLAVYEGEAEEQSDKLCLDAYYKAVDAVRIWLRLVELLDMTEARYMESVAVLHLPDDDITVSVSTRAILDTNQSRGSSKDFNAVIEGFDIGWRDLLVTPIGEMSDVTLKHVLGVADNPVMLLYRHLGDLLHLIHNILSMPLHDQIPANVLLTEELLREHGIQDVLGVYKMDKVLFDIDSFFESQVTY